MQEPSVSQHNEQRKAYHLMNTARSTFEPDIGQEQCDFVTGTDYQMSEREKWNRRSA